MFTISPRILFTLAFTMAIMITLIKESIIRSVPVNPQKAIVIAHRGSSGLRPEHTISAYDLAASVGADFIEQDIVSTKDGELVVLHDRELGSTTNIAQMGYNTTTKLKLDRTDLDSTEMEEDYFVEDYTLDQLKALRVKQRFDFREASYDFLFPLLTMRELLQYAEAKHRERKTLDTAPIGLYVELKHPAYFDSLGLKMEQKFLDLLIEFGYVKRIPESERRSSPSESTVNRHINLTGGVHQASAASDNSSMAGNEAVARDVQNYQSSSPEFRINPEKPIIIQCFEGTTLKFFRKHIDGIQTVHLIKENHNIIQEDRPSLRYADMLTEEGLKEVSTYATGIGPHKSSILTFDSLGTRTSTGLVKRAHDAGLVVHPYTFRSDYPVYFKKEEWGLETPQDEVIAFLEEGIDGLFSDWPAHAVSAVTQFSSKRSFTVDEAPESSMFISWAFSALAIGVIASTAFYMAYKSYIHRKKL